jgi:hypothetical protein
MLSGILTFFDEDHIKLIDRVLAGGGEYEDIEIRSENINRILDENHISEIDYCSIDTEGAELSIIKSIDFDKINIKSFSIEKAVGDCLVRNILKTKGYICISGVLDGFYIKKSAFSCYNILLCIMAIKCYKIYTEWYATIHHIAHIIKMSIYNLVGRSRNKQHVSNG